MAPEKKATKRKAPATATAAPAVSEHPPSKKSKKTQEKPVNTETIKVKASSSKSKKENSTVNGAKSEKLPVKVDKKPAKELKPRKRAADFLSDDEEEAEKEVVSKPKAEKKETQPKKKAKSEKPAASAELKEKSSATAEKKKKTKSKTKEVEKEPEEVSEPVDEEQVSPISDADSDDEVEDDQTLALIRGFESSGDEDASEDEGFEPGQEVPKIPDSKKAMKAIRKKKKENSEPEEPGTVYVGRIPHGFYEDEMRAYFSQFGEISRLRLSRNRTTGKSKHYAFIEFTSTSVAKVVAATMQNYLMFGHILKCKYIPNDKVHPAMWKGANRRFKKTPWNQIEKRRLDAGKSRDGWSKAISKESSKRAKKAEKMKALGYEYEIPTLKSVEEVPVAPTVQDQIEEGTTAPIAAIEDKKDETLKKKESKSKAEAKDKTVTNGKASKEKKTEAEPAETGKKSAEKKEAKKPKKKVVNDTPATSEKPTKVEKQPKSAPKAKKVEEKPKKVKKAKA
ncbi:MKI67 FHA domain-interacting nucleolar phosphoprotein [Nannizzia gypsea CBS 118893]|uniref:MKI67 FHA domain-interacting nucleolar phosphoprotein n=1 Tax=Arthroderma gypseum (strain ATCC MYA-4604 / CBS 118893) TaxID=535722 RepID=E5R3W1_ARTGP|nr:MKI67 FHA domain-interacting nucleolar phosphoprotein [Nannizzia gypsea CBS 118893]EFQ98807.1 MKI67 FHA domain-interacting nucleolar phosphoprotein [Nannizzia gypsea CBS 118893]